MKRKLKYIVYQTHTEVIDEQKTTSYKRALKIAKQMAKKGCCSCEVEIEKLK